ncbi:MAG: ribonuclease HII [Candidatus Sericytochromatia bacterium]|nr:ribonuclease HII [Candidatus Sericytochromatia bacterium]
MNQLLEYEKKLWNEYNFIAGVDEVGRGCLAGPVVAGVVILPKSDNILSKLKYVNDSKLLSSKKRRELFSIIQESAIDYGVGIVSANVIDQINILQATFLSMRRALASLSSEYNYILVDGNKTIPRVDTAQMCIIKGDSKSLSIAAASILAKVIRDEIMIEIDKNYVGFSFEKHKGYGTKIHIEAIKKFGLTDIHRVSFCKNFS